MAESNEIVRVDTAEPMFLDTTGDIISMVAKRAEMMDKLIDWALRSTNHQDWVDQNGKPWLQGSGAEKVARRFGIKWSGLVYEKIISEDEKGKFYFYKVTGNMRIAIGDLDEIEAIGTCSSKDQFFAVKYEGDEKVFKPLSEVDETNIMKSAFTNFIINGVTRLLGLRNLSWEQVKKAGVDISKIAKVEYAGSQESTETTGLRTEVWTYIKDSMCGGDEAAGKKKLAELTTWNKKKKGGGYEVVKGHEDMAALSEKQLGFLDRKLRSDHGMGQPKDTTAADTAAEKQPTFEEFFGMFKNQEKEVLPDFWRSVVKATHLTSEEKRRLQEVYDERMKPIGGEVK